jgi:predicted acylesterase/phospholipase RssA
VTATYPVACRRAELLLLSKSKPERLILSDNSRTDDAFVLAGNGANAAYEVGVMKALLRGSWGKNANPPVNPYCFSGTSLGGFNAAVMVSLAEQSLQDGVGCLERIWLDKIAVSSAKSSTGFFRVRAEPTQYFNFESVLNPLKPSVELMTDMLHFGEQAFRRFGWAVAASNTVPDGAVRFSELNEWIDIGPVTNLIRTSIDLSKIARSSKMLRVTAVNWTNGSPKIFENSDFSREDGHQIVLAALAVPGVVAAQAVEGIPYVDGSVFIDSPLRPAISARPKGRDGGLVLHAIYLDANKTQIPQPALSNTFSTIYRVYLLAASRALGAALDGAQITNARIRTKETFDTIRKEQNLSAEAKILLEELTEELDNRVPLTVHRFTPTKHIHGFELQQFEKESIRQLIQHGYEDALEHDCAKSKCICPGVGGSSS